MNYETLNDIDTCVSALGHVLVEKDALKFNVNLSEAAAMKNVAFVWNCLPEMIAEMRRLVRDHERMTAFLRAIQQISVDSMRCTSQMMLVDDWHEALPNGMAEEISEIECIRLGRNHDVNFGGTDKPQLDETGKDENK